VLPSLSLGTFEEEMPRTRRIQLPDGNSADAEVVSFQSHGEHWNEYILDDGTLLKLKPVVTEILRIEGLFDAAGNPAYLINSTNVVGVDAPDELKREGGDPQ
jgi:hypothetical protein